MKCVKPVLLVLVVLVGAGCSTPVEMFEVSRRDVAQRLSEDAVTRLADEFVVDMPVSGTLTRLEWEVGDHVKKGGVIAQVEPFELQQGVREIEAAIRQLEAQLEGVDIAKPKEEDIETAELRVREARDAEAIAKRELTIATVDYEEAEKKYRRAQELLRQNAVSQSFYDEAERAYKSLQENIERAKLGVEASQKAREIAEIALRRLTESIDDNEYMREAYHAEIEGLKSRLQVMKRDLDKTEIRSPVSGPVLELYVEDQRVLAAGSPILRVGDMDSVEIECDVLSEEVSAVKPGQKVEISGKALQGRVVHGRVERIHPSGFKKLSALGIEQQRVRVIISFDPSDTELRPGTSVDVTIITDEQQNVLAVPERSTFKNEGQWSVFVVEGGKARLRPVELGLKNDEWAEVKEGLEQGDLIITEPSNSIADGMRVKPIK